MDLGPRGGEHDEGRVRRGAERVVEAAHARRVAPVQVFQDEQERPAPGLGGEVHAERAPDLLPQHELVLPCSAELHAVPVVEGHTHELAHELGDELAAGGDQRVDAGTEDPPAVLDRRALVEVEEGPERAPGWRRASRR
ncbi:MAG: hypothetical protein U0359_20585 [Byssovorax sp.]